MHSTYALARDHLQRAATILQGDDRQAGQIRYIIERTISLIDDFRPAAPTVLGSNVLDLAAIRAKRRLVD